MFCQQMEVALVLCFLSGMALGRHTMNVATLGEPILTIDPFASGTVASASSSGASASAASTAGSSRTSSVSSSVSRIQRPLSGSSASASALRRAFITTINGQNVLVVPSGAHAGLRNLASRTPSGSNLRNSNLGNGLGTMVVPESSLNISPMQQLQLQQQQQQNSLLQSAPPGLQFLGRSIPTGNIILSGQNPVQTQLVAQPLQQAADGIFIDVNTGKQVFGQPVLQQNGGSVIFSGQAPLRTQLVAQPLQHTAGGIFIDANTGQQVFAQTASQQNGGGLIFVDNPSLPTQGNPIFDSVGQAATLGVTPGQPSFSQQGIPIPNSQHLRLIGLTPRGDLIIDGPGGTITIGADVLNGIITPNAFPVATEFEELENELLRGTRGNKNKVKVLDPGNGAITLEKKTPAGRNNGGSGLKTVEASSSSSTADTKAVAAASSSASAGGASASSSAGSASASSNSLTGRVVLGNGVTLNNGVITIDSAAGNSQLNIGGISHGHQSEGASGIQAPGNATILITG